MINFSYTVSPFLKKQLEDLDQVRDSILLTLISPQDDTRLRWEVLIERVTASSYLSKNPLKKSEAIQLLGHLSAKDTTSTQDVGLKYRRGYEYIQQNWIMNDEIISPFHLVALYHLVSSKELSIPHKDLSTMLSFLQVNPEHPVIQAAIAYIIFYQMLGANQESKSLSILLAYLFLYKNGYDLRGMLNLEEYIEHYENSFFEVVGVSLQTKNLSAYLDHFTLAVVTQAEKGLERIKARRFKVELPDSYFQLTERQKELLSLFERPSSKITNKIVQHHFKVSQITASRELSKLAGLGLIFSMGKGRSVYYTKA